MINKPKVTIVISTYNRPDVLRIVIRSIILQTYSNWKILVIGDHCDQETENCVISFNDSRIHYINLPYRIGEQAGPNSVGIALSNTEYIAFMNHDDILISDHLEYAIGSLERTNKDFFISKCAFTHDSKNISENLKEPIFDLISPDNRTPDMSFNKTPRLFESASSWLVKTSTAKKIGYWKLSREIHRNPLQNWILRSWQKKTNFFFGERITILKFNTHQKIKKNIQYSAKGLEHLYILNLLENQNVEFVREFVKKSLMQNKKPFPKDPNIFANKKLHPILRKLIINQVTKNIFKYTGIDSYEIYFSSFRYKKGEIMNMTSLGRTGKSLPEKVNIKMLIDKVLANRND